MSSDLFAPMVRALKRFLLLSSGEKAGRSVRQQDAIIARDETRQKLERQSSPKKKHKILREPTAGI